MDAKQTAIAGLTLVLTSGAAVAAPLTAQLTFVGIAPCRIIDTRAGQGFTGGFGPPALIANATRTFQITGTTTGTPTQCGIPDTAVAISVNFTVTGFGGQGDIRVFPAGGALPAASILNFQLENIANATTVPLGSSGTGHNGISVRSDAVTTEFIADVNGYYLPASTLASGQTITGDWTVSTYGPTAGAAAYASISFPVKLASAPLAPSENYVYAGAPSTVSCPGTVSNPLAAAGQLCVYEGGCSGARPFFFGICQPSSPTVLCGLGDTRGAFVLFGAPAEGSVVCSGSWAVTAP